MLVKLLLGFAIGLFLTYPAAILTTVIEGQSATAIYSYHLPTSLFSYLAIALPVFLFLHLRGHFQLLDLHHKDNKKNLVIMLAILFLYAVMVFWQLGRANILGDDYDLAYQAYNLQDGIQAARKAYVMSFNTHPPLFMTIKHYWFQIMFPNGLETVPSWGYRGLEGILGMATLLAVYAITRNLWAPAILAVNNYLIFLGRVYLREMYLTFFLTLSLYFFQKKSYFITAFLIGCGLLVKTSAIVVVPVYLLLLLSKKEYRNILKMAITILVIYLPVISYNILAFYTTGHMDATFSKIFGLPHPFLTDSSTPLLNIASAISYLKDIYSLPVLIIFVVAAIINFRSIYFLLLISSFLYFIFGGPLREYYLLFMTIPFVIFTGNFFSRHSVRTQNLLPSIFILFSFWYSVSGLSNIRKLYEPVRGWPKLMEEVKAVYQPGDCLEKGGGVNDLAIRAYFQTDDAPKKILLGNNYPHYYKMCDEQISPARKINIFYNQSGLVNYKII